MTTKTGSMTEHKESGFRFEHMWLRELRFEDADHKSPPATRELNTEFTVTVEIADDESHALVSVAVAIKPSDANDFTLLSARLEGLFVPATPESKLKLREFAEKQASALIVPFLRELIANITVRARGGGILLPPINLYGVVGSVGAKVEARSRD